MSQQVFYNGRAAFDRVGKIIDLAQTVACPAYDALFRSPDFNTFLLTAYSSGAKHNNWLDVDGFTPTPGFPMLGDGVQASEREIERQEVGRLGDYLLYSNRYPGKRFIILNHEGDHAFWDLKNRKECPVDPNDEDKCSVPNPNDLFANRWDDFRNWIQARADGVTDSRNRYPGSTAKLFSGVEFFWVETPYVWATGGPSYDANGAPIGTIIPIYQVDFRSHVPCGTPSEEIGRPFKYRCVSDYVAPNVNVDYYSYSAYEITNIRYFDSSTTNLLRSKFKELLSTRDNPNNNNPNDRSVLKKIQAVRGTVIGEENFIIGEWSYDYLVVPPPTQYIGEMLGAFDLNDSCALHPSYITYYQLLSTKPGYTVSCGDNRVMGCGRLAIICSPKARAEWLSEMD